MLSRRVLHMYMWPVSCHLMCIVKIAAISLRTSRSVTYIQAPDLIWPARPFPEK